MDDKLTELLIRLRRREEAKASVRRAREIAGNELNGNAQRRAILRRVAQLYIDRGFDQAVLAAYAGHKNEIHSLETVLSVLANQSTAATTSDTSSNPYLDKFMRLAPADFDDELLILLREVLVDEYAWAVPDERALALLADYAPLIEIGCGTGYWAALLQARGIDILAVDKTPVESGLNDSYTRPSKSFMEIVVAGEEILDQHRQRTLLISWPPDFSAMPGRALSRYAGNSFIYIGESDRRGQEPLYSLLERDWQIVESVDIPQWPGYHDWLQVYERKR